MRTSTVITPEEYVASLPDDRREAVAAVRERWAWTGRHGEELRVVRRLDDLPLELIGGHRTH